MNDILQKIQELEMKRNTLMTELETEFLSLFKPIFEKYSDIRTISWHQYTPYFNDGDECTFGVYTEYFQINDEEVEHEANNEILKIFSQIPEDYYKEIFGDHAEITLTSSEISIKEYYHD